MPRGPGKYDAPCAAARTATEADVCLLVVLGGRLGDGFSAQFVTYDPARPPASLLAVPGLLRQIADQIEADQQRGQW